MSPLPGATAGWATRYANSLHKFFASQNATKPYGNQYSISGRELSSSHSPGLVAMNAVAALAATEPLAWSFVRTPQPRAPHTWAGR